MTKRTYLLTVELIALDTVKKAVAMGLTVWCERTADGWLVTVEK